MSLVGRVVGSYSGGLGALNGVAVGRLAHCGNVKPTGTVAILTTYRLKGHHTLSGVNCHPSLNSSLTVCGCVLPGVRSLGARRT